MTGTSGRKRQTKICLSLKTLHRSAGNLWFRGQQTGSCRFERDPDSRRVSVNKVEEDVLQLEAPDDKFWFLDNYIKHHGDPRKAENKAKGHKIIKMGRHVGVAVPGEVDKSVPWNLKRLVKQGVRMEFEEYNGWEQGEMALDEAVQMYEDLGAEQQRNYERSVQGISYAEMQEQLTADETEGGAATEPPSSAGGTAAAPATLAQLSEQFGRRHAAHAGAMDPGADCQEADGDLELRSPRLKRRQLRRVNTDDSDFGPAVSTVAKPSKASAKQAAAPVGGAAKKIPKAEAAKPKPKVAKPVNSGATGVLGRKQTDLVLYSKQLLADYAAATESSNFFVGGDQTLAELRSITRYLAKLNTQIDAQEMQRGNLAMTKDEKELLRARMRLQIVEAGSKAYKLKSAGNGSVGCGSAVIQKLAGLQSFITAFEEDLKKSGSPIEATVPTFLKMFWLEKETEVCLANSGAAEKQKLAERMITSLDTKDIKPLLVKFLTNALRDTSIDVTEVSDCIRAYFESVSESLRKQATSDVALKTMVNDFLYFTCWSGGKHFHAWEELRRVLRIMPSQAAAPSTMEGNLLQCFVNMKVHGQDMIKIAQGRLKQHDEMNTCWKCVGGGNGLWEHALKNKDFAAVCCCMFWLSYVVRMLLVLSVA